jgi:uncharacterized protein YndB with AHSA1/START domain
MPTQKDLKRRVRDRMKKTGESYTTARRQLLARRQALPAPAADYAALAGMSDTKVHAQTGRTWAGWVRVLDGIRATEMPHREIALRVSSMGVPEWWTQTVTVGYERIRGLRQRGQRRDGAFEASKSRTFDVPVGVLFDAFADARTRRKWLPDEVAVRSANRPKRMRIVWHDATTVQVEFAAKSPGKSSVAIQHQKLPDRAAAEAAKQSWASRFERLRDLLTAG